MNWEKYTVGSELTTAATSDQLRVPYSQGAWDTRLLPKYEFLGYGNSFVCHDPVWGTEEFKKDTPSGVFVDLAANDFVRRQLCIEQLTLPELFSTLASTHHMARFEHIFGSVVLARKIQRRSGFDVNSKDQVRDQLRTFVSDLGQTAFSHLGDWITEGFGGTEDQHDKELYDLLQKTGIEQIIKQHGFTLDEVVFPDISDYIECDSPANCIDRQDYGMREMLRLFPMLLGEYTLNQYGNHETNAPNAFIEKHITLGPNKELCFTDPKFARSYSELFLLLPTEHFGQPFHRLVLYLFKELVKRPMVNGDDFHFGSSLHPRDGLYRVDTDFLTGLRKLDGVTTPLTAFLEAKTIESRHISWGLRHQDIESYYYSITGGKSKDFLNPTEYFSEWAADGAVGPLPQGIRFQRISEEEALSYRNGDSYFIDPVHKDTLVVFLSRLKPRAINPHVLVDGELKKVSDIYPDFGERMEQQKEYCTQNYLAFIPWGSEKNLAKIVSSLNESDELWEKASDRKRLDSDQFNQLVADAILGKVNVCPLN